MKEKVIQISCTNDTVYGITIEGHLVFFDKEANSWVIRCYGDILSVDRANVLKKPIDVYGEPVRYRDNSTIIHEEVTCKMNKMKRVLAIVSIVAACAYVIYCAYLIYRHVF